MMEYIFEVEKDPYGLADECEDENIPYLFEMNQLTLVNGINVITGCNGYGKTTLLDELKENLDKKNIPFLSYKNDIQGKDYFSAAMFNGNISEGATFMLSSEGEKIVLNLMNQARGLIKKIKASQSDTFFILMDAVDSGLSIDNIIDLKEYIFKPVLEMNEKSIYIVVTANTYEMASGERCIDAHTGKVINFANYEEYKQYIEQCREIKDKRYNID